MDLQSSEHSAQIYWVREMWGAMSPAEKAVYEDEANSTTQRSSAASSMDSQLDSQMSQQGQEVESTQQPVVTAPTSVASWLQTPSMDPESCISDTKYRYRITLHGPWPMDRPLSP